MNNSTSLERKELVNYPDFLKTYRCNILRKDMLNDKTPFHNLIPFLLNKDKIKVNLIGPINLKIG